MRVSRHDRSTSLLVPSLLRRAEPMNTARSAPPPPPVARAKTLRLASVRSQAAFVRSLLDEVERLAPAGADPALTDQLVEELARLGCRCLDAASSLAADDASRTEN